MVVLDHVSSQGHAHYLSRVVRRLFDQRARERRLQGGACVAGGCHATDGVIQVLSEEQHRLELIAGWMVELDIKGS